MDHGAFCFEIRKDLLDRRKSLPFWKRWNTRDGKMVKKESGEGNSSKSS